MALTKVTSDLIDLTGLDERYYLQSEVDAAIASASGSVAVRDDGVTTVSVATILDFIGSGVTVTDAGGGVASITISAGPQSVDTVFGRTGTVVATSGDYTLDQISDGSTYVRLTSTEKNKLTGIETLADVTDATNVDAAGAVMNSDTTIAAMSFVIDDDTMATASATKLSTSESIKAYVDARTVGDGDYGDVTVSGTGTVITIDAGVVTNAKSANMATSRVKGRISSGTGVPEDLTPTQVGTLLDGAYNSSFWRDGGGVNILEDGTVAGDGSTDDGSAINAVLTAAGVGATIYFPAASGYKTSIPLVPLAQQKLVGLGGFGAVELIGDGVTGAIIQPNDDFGDAGKTGLEISNFKFSGTCDYGIRLINCTRFRLQDLWFNYGNAVSNVSDLTNDCINIGDSWGGLIERVYAYVETATTTPARSVIWAEGAINGTTISRLETAAGTQYGIWLGDEDLIGDDDPALPSGCSFEGITLQRHEIALYAKRCRGVSVNGFYAEFNQIAIRCGSDDSTTDRCTNLIVQGGHITSLDGTTYGWADNSTGAIELIRAYGCVFNSVNFSDYGSGDSEQMLYVKRAYGCAVNNPTRFNFAMSDMRPAISFDGSVDANSRVTVTGNGTYGDQTLKARGSSVFSEEDGTAAPSSGAYVVGDRVYNVGATAGGAIGWVCVSAGSPGTWKTFGQVSA